MKSKVIPILIANLFCASSLMAQEAGDDGKLTGNVSVGGVTDRVTSNDAAKFQEYRDLGNGLRGGFDLKDRTSQGYFNLFGENVGRDDQTFDVRGGAYNKYKYQLYDNKLVHNWAFGALTPYSGAGTSNLTATTSGTGTAMTLNTNTATWNKVDYGIKREITGGNIEFSFGSPWYVRYDANQIHDRGIKLIAGSNGTSPGQGFIDKPLPVNYLTLTNMVEWGYTTKRAHWAVNLTHSKFNSENETLNWTNPYFGGGMDTTTLATDSTYTKFGANGMLRELPMSSTLSGRMTYSRTTSSVAVQTSALNSTAGAFSPTNPDNSNFDGRVDHKTASLSLHSNPSQTVDSRIYWNWFKRDNKSTEITFATAAVAGLACSGANCVTEVMNYKKSNLGIDLGYRMNPKNRLVFGFDYLDLNRHRRDFDETKDRKTSLEWRNTSFDSVGLRAKYQHLARRSNFLEGQDGTGPADPNYLNRFVARFDASNVDQNLFKLGMDVTPAESWDIGIEGIVKNNKYKDTTLGRTKDDRYELYLGLGYGDAQKFRVMTFADAEYVRYESAHRNISNLAATDAYDPNATPNNSNYNWNAINRDRNYSFGIGADWVPASRWKTNASYIWQLAHGMVDFAVQQGATPAIPSTPINNYDNVRKNTVNLKATYAWSKRLDLSGGYAWEKYRYSDIATDGYQYTIVPATASSSSYLSGVGAKTDYTASIVYLNAILKFQ